MGDQVVEVDCYSGASYAERPRALIFHGNKIEVSQILCSQLTPGSKVFKVILENGWTVTLQYSLQADHWTASGLPN
jgi:hypothetical protein